ncbi:MAG: hypothetical protein ACREJX_09905 [Polyangiaceae bacterium]
MNGKIVYEHRQIGWVTIVVIVGVIAALSVALAISERNGEQQRAFNVVIIVVAVIGAIFSSLTIRITDRSMAWWFGVPMIGRQIRLDEVESIGPTRTNIMEGWGIHLTWWHGWVWNVSGFNAVQIKLRSGMRFAVGTPEPQAVVEAVERASGSGKR